LEAPAMRGTLGMSPTSPSGSGEFAPSEVRRRLRRRLHAEPPPGLDDPRPASGRGDHDLNAHHPREHFFDGPPRPAAVLLPIMAHAAGTTVLLTRRCDDLPSHGGQVAFPGGKIEPQDPSPLAAALREAEEEVGLAPANVDIVGYLDLYRTGSGFAIVPAVALVDPAAALRPDPSEVAAIFEVPLAFLMEAANHQRHSRMWRGMMRTYYAMPYGEHYIWGATAGILRNLYDRVFD
jgi:8-oxo-dGTP pyrophosphatase MutT (NUDIX family)